MSNNKNSTQIVSDETVESRISDSSNMTTSVDVVQAASETETQEAINLAAVDLGSNSFHMIVARYEHGEFTIIDRQRETVRLAEGLDEDNRLDDAVAQRALDCLAKFGQLLRGLDTDNVRVVGTNALRRMKSRRRFMEQAEKALGQNIEIIAGREEARLIYLGVSKWSEKGDKSRLVIDIGGGSTEVIVGKGDTPLCRESLEMGCVGISQAYFADGVLSKQRFQQARVAAELAIQPVISLFRTHGWQTVIGCSGTIKALAEIADRHGWSKEGISYDAVQKIVDYAIEKGHVNELNLEGLSADRLPVFAGGLTVLMAVFEAFQVEHMEVSQIALREGVLYDMVGRSSHQDMRDVTVAAMLTRWSIDAEHGEAVKNTALSLYDQISEAWDIGDGEYRSTLGWAAQLHELGLLISHDAYQKHGGYVIGNADMAGFAKRDQLLLAALILGHRRKFPLDVFEELPASLVTPAKRLAVLLRMAVLLHRDRGAVPDDVCEVVKNDTHIRFQFHPQWLKNHPLTEADLSQEQLWLKSVGIKLKFK